MDALHTSSTYEHLFVIDFGANVIGNFNVSILRLMTKLGRFYLNDNKLKHIDDFRSLYLGTIDLNNNPWHCGVELSWMGGETMAFEGPLTCATPTCLQGMTIADMSK